MYYLGTINFIATLKTLLKKFIDFLQKKKKKTDRPDEGPGDGVSL